MTLHICSPVEMDRRLIRLPCPTCDKRRYFLAWSYEWYGPTHVCLRCGETWRDGERADRPFARGWRKRSIESAKRQWRVAAPAARGEARA